MVFIFFFITALTCSSSCDTETLYWTNGESSYCPSSHEYLAYNVSKCGTEIPSSFLTWRVDSVNNQLIVNCSLNNVSARAADKIQGWWAPDDEPSVEEVVRRVQSLTGVGSVASSWYAAGWSSGATFLHIRFCDNVYPATTHFRGNGLCGCSYNFNHSRFYHWKITKLTMKVPVF